MKMDFDAVMESPVARKLMASLFYEADTDYLSPVMTPRTECKLTSLLNNVDISEAQCNKKRKHNVSRRLSFYPENCDTGNNIPSRPAKKRRVGGQGKRCVSEAIANKTTPEVKSSPKGKVVPESMLEQLIDGKDLIGDGSRPYCLPTVKGKHKDLKSISTKTLVDVMNGCYDDVVGRYRIIDCRYPYEFQGGHIKNAENVYTEEGIIDLLSDHRPLEGGKRDILIFHCEFSSERGPKKCRFLRNRDRQMHQENYPCLNFPEVYILDQGYKQFFHDYKEMCSPMGYKPMLHSDHNEDLRHFRKKSKTWTAGEKRNLSRLNLRF